MSLTGWLPKTDSCCVASNDDSLVAVRSSAVLTALLVSVCFVLAGHLFVLQREPGARDQYLAVRGDALAYVAMVQGDWTDAPVPFRYRVLVPFVARLLPWSPIASLRVVTYLSLLGSYTLIILTCLRLGVSKMASTLGLFAAWSAGCQLYFYHNPFLTDGFALLALSAMVFSLSFGSFRLFVVASVLGVLARETVLVLVPVWWLDRDVKRGAQALVVACCAFLVPRLLIGAPGHLGHSLKAAFLTSAVVGDPLGWARNAYLSWGFVWILAVVGLFLVSSGPMPNQLTVLISLVGGGVIFSFFATDTGRMLAIAAPILAVGCSGLFAALAAQRKRFLLWLAVPLIVGHALLALPNRVLVPREGVSGVFRIAYTIIEAVYAVTVAATLRRELFGSRGEVPGVSEP